ncbi:hypothetical protein SAMN04488550_0616 [Gordonia malaquae]|uniref:Uncharacterized protein n=1 Tax=Gordonia malaquae NBRC 108250 TaxID=1223542 RepID=M3TH89_GORML|nr:hypothetical protein [Gordonia malaquae]GAC80821.1 hypothetical protein GM1_022_00310 [Gordonia malaquae NBRC 108250]SEB68577.1 hypothetical protein SAMN04488550_0616 [Gordonia malaquae]
MTDTITDPWVQRQVAAGLVPERARTLDRADVARRYNRVHNLAPDHDDYLYSPGQAQQTARDALAFMGIDLTDGTRIVLTDGVAGRRGRAYVANVGQIEAGVEEHRLVTGETISADALIQALPWE